MNLYQIKITLDHVEPKIWRRFLVPDDTCLGDLHVIIQVIMGWENEHLHEFTINKRRYGYIDPDYPADVEDEDNYILKDLLKSGSKFSYNYDFGDDWNHQLHLEKMLPPKKDTFYPVCTDGERACPPEDCGGFPGYMNMLEILNNPGDEEHEEIKEWLGEDFDPEGFALDKVNQGLWRLYQD